MKVVCQACERIATAASFRQEGGRLLIRCGRCGQEGALEVEASPPPPAPIVPPLPSPLTTPPPRVLPLRSVSDAVRIAADAAEEQDPFEVPPDRCPKCIGPREPDATVCPHCGLAYVNFRAEDVAPSDELREAFVAALKEWDEQALHDRALMIATQRGELPQLGRLYRLRQVAAPLDPMAQRGRDEVLRRATAATEVLRAAEAPRQRTARAAQYAAIAIAGAALIGLVIALARSLLS